MISLLFFYAALFVIGSSVCAVLLPGALNSERLGIAIAFGAGSSSLVSFLWLNCLGSLEGLQYLLIGIAGLAAWMSYPLLKSRSMAATKSECWSFGEAVTILATVGIFIVQTVAAWQNPFGQWDGLVTWNMHARFLAADNTVWGRLFDIRTALTDYPLLLPLTVAQSWSIASQQTPVIPALLSLVFAGATALTLFGALHRNATRLHACSGLLILVSSPPFASSAVSQMADVPLSLYYLIAVVMISSSVSGAPGTYLFACGAATGLAAWTKNEGLLFAAVMTGVVIAVQLWRKATRQILWYTSGLAIPLVAVSWFKCSLAPRSNLVGRIPSIEEFLSDGSRYNTLARMLAEETTTYARGGVMLVLFVAMILGAHGPLRKAALVSLCVLVLTLAGYFSIFILTPYPIEWHVRTSLSRLLTELWPSFVFAVLTLAASDSSATPTAGARGASSHSDRPTAAAVR